MKKPGSACQTPVSSIDLYPTLLELANIEPSKNQVLDGVSLLPAFLGAVDLSRERLFWHFLCYVGRATPSSAVRKGDFKFIEFYEDGGRRVLYNLQSDPNEERDLASSMPDKAAEMYRTLQAWQSATGAAIPREANPQYDARAERPRGAQGTSGNGSRGKTPNGAANSEK